MAPWVGPLDGRDGGGPGGGRERGGGPDGTAGDGPDCTAGGVPVVDWADCLAPGGNTGGGSAGGGPAGGSSLLSNESKGTGGELILDKTGGSGGPLNILDENIPAAAGLTTSAGDAVPLEFSKEGVRGGIGGGPVGMNVGRVGGFVGICSDDGEDLFGGGGWAGGTADGGGGWAGGIADGGGGWAGGITDGGGGWAGGPGDGNGETAGGVGISLDPGKAWVFGLVIIRTFNKTNKLVFILNTKL